MLVPYQLGEFANTVALSYLATARRKQIVACTKIDKDNFTHNLIFFEHW